MPKVPITQTEIVPQKKFYRLKYVKKYKPKRGKKTKTKRKK